MAYQGRFYLRRFIVRQEENRCRLKYPFVFHMKKSPYLVTILEILNGTRAFKF